jgi:rhamnulokinase
MTAGTHCIAADLGAESCRVSLASWNGTSLELRLVHRFANGPFERDGHLFWNLDRILQGIAEGVVEAARAAGGPIASLGVDGWAVDYVRLDRERRPLGMPFCYRDRRTEGAMRQVWDRIPAERLYEITGIQFLRFNTLYQLYADRLDGVGAGDRWLNLPEFAMHALGGEAVAEFTNATHTQLVDARARRWSDEIFAAVGLDRGAAAEIVEPGTSIGTLRPEALPLAAGVLPANLRATKLIVPCCHDTGSAVAGIPAAPGAWAFISSGTWSLVGAVHDGPITTAAARNFNLSNEGGIGGRVRLLRNVNGMWLLEECIREWARQGANWPVADLIARARQLDPLPQTFDVDAPELLPPGDMPARIAREIEKAGFAVPAAGPENAPALAQIIFRSLARRYRRVLQQIAEVTGAEFERIYIVGGGSRNDYLNELVEEAAGVKVMRGAVESATAGNAAVQCAALEGDPSPERVAWYAARVKEASGGNLHTMTPA